METLVPIFEMLSTLSPLGLAGLLAYVIYLLVRGKTAADAKVETVASNHLHELPEAIQILRDMQKTLERLDSYLRARLNGQGDYHG
jgi:hypothetical protein